jgi:type II secretion system (T2SS) protein E
MRLGEFFVRKGIITPAQLDEALKGQLIFGGHLGTCLLEMGYIEEAMLGRSLGEIFGVNYAPPHLFENIPRNVVEKLPKRLVEKHHAVPFDLRDRTLDVAMIDPRNLPALDELSFASGVRINPWVSPEARIFQVMERYYDVPRRQRYISVCQDLDEGAKAGGAGRARTAYASGYAPPPHVSALALGSSREAAPTLAPLETLQPDAARIPAAAAGEARAGTPQAGLADALCAAESMGDIAAAAVAYAGRGMTRVALFLVRGTTATLWYARGTGQDGLSRSEAVSLSVTTDPLFDLLHERDHYHGPLPRDARFDAFFTELKMERGTDVLLVPGYLDDRLVVLLYGDGGPFGLVESDIDDTRLLIARIAVAIQLLFVKKRLRTLELPPAEAAPAKQAA